jgi:hypothetical protein
MAVPRAAQERWFKKLAGSFLHDIQKAGGRVLVD